MPASPRPATTNTYRRFKFALMEWADWYNNARLHYLTPAEYEAAYYTQHTPRRPALA
ncbi:IS3 family transposase [Nocardia sp. R6R-6]|uniref:IS3 family transposase n=1 Tax=Nocardia sp. R6R-6 TaxID=3459303 RepID=UPI00403D58C9